MDKIKWLQEMVAQSPADPQANYWLGKELAENGRYHEAISSISTAISNCAEDRLRNDMVNELVKISSHLKQEENTSPSLPDVPMDGEVNFPQSSINKTKPFQPMLKVIDGNAAPTNAKQETDDVTFADVAGLEDLKKTIHLRIISPFFNKGLFAKFRKKIGGGILFYGPPGCGKTFIARATAGECNAHFYPVRITDILDPYIGVSERNLKDIFDKARFQKPSILFFDEVDTIGFSRSKSSSNTRGLIDTFLTEMEGIDSSTDEILVMAATNTPWDVDNALKRPGRFDRLIFVAPPDEEAREQIFKLKVKGRFAENIDTQLLASKTEFFSGADIENVVELASEHLIEEILTKGTERPLTTEDFLQALENVQPSTLDWLRTVKNYVKYSNHGGLYNDVEKYLSKHSRRI
ncbi:AAA family ATPase [Solibacillus silvestris]|uniref:ATP-binding protein n=1 Tax=Solibacillus silvestris TaxID=76853 RepID=UPI003F7DC0BC